jgi:uncharacterized protein YutD
MSDYVYLYCPYGCGDFVKHEILNGDKRSAELASQVGMNLHKGKCPNRPKEEKKDG